MLNIPPFALDHRPEFVPSIIDSHPKAKTAENLDAYREATRFYAQRFNECDYRERALMGKTIGDLFIAKLHHLNVSGADRKDFHALRRYYTDILGDVDAGSIFSGFTAEYGVARALSSEMAGYNVYLPTAEEDFRHKVDLWLDLGDDSTADVTTLALQIKVANARAGSKDLLMPIRDTNSVVDVARTYGDHIHDHALFVRNGTHLLDYARTFDGVQACLIMLPALDNKPYSQIDPITGVPTRKLAEMLYQNLDNKILSLGRAKETR